MEDNSSGTQEGRVARILKLVTSEDTLLAGLQKLFDVLKKDEDREKVLKLYLQRSRECKELLEYFKWERSKQTPEGLLLCLELLETVLLCTASSVGQVHSAGVGLVRTVLQNHMRVVYSSLASTSSSKSVALALRLLTVMVTQSPGCARDVFTLFDFSYKYLENASHHRKNSNVLLMGRIELVGLLFQLQRANSVRRCFINFSLSFLVIGSADVVQGILGMKKFLEMVLRDLHKDSVDTAQMVLSVVKEKVVQNEAVSKKAKSAFFGTTSLTTIAQFLILGDTHWAAWSEEAEPEANEMDLPLSSYHLLLELCTNFKVGICYKPKWDHVAVMKTNNPVLLSFVLSLSTHLEQKLVALLVIKILCTCPDLLLPFLKSFPHSFEPRPAKKYVVAMEFVLKVYSCLPDLRSIYRSLKSHDLDHTPTPVVLGYCIPPAITRGLLSTGLQSPSILVKHYSLSVLNLCLNRALPLVEEGDHNIRGGLKEFRDDLVRLLPDVKTLISLHHNLSKGKETVKKEEQVDVLPSDLVARIKEVAESGCLLAQVLDVMASLQLLMPLVFLQAGFDAGKLLIARGSQSHTDWHRSDILIQTLKFLSSLPKGALKWHHQGSVNLKTIVELIFHHDPSVVVSSRRLLESVLSEIPQLECLHLEVKLVLNVLSDQSKYRLCDSTGQEAVIELFVLVFGHMMRDSDFSFQIASEVRAGTWQHGNLETGDMLGLVPYAFIIQMILLLQKQQKQQQPQHQQQQSCLVFVGELLQKSIHFVSQPALLSKVFLSKLVSEDLLDLILPSLRSYYQSLLGYFAAVGGHLQPLQISLMSSSGVSTSVSLKRRLKSVYKAAEGSPDISQLISEVLCTSSDLFEGEVLKALKWAKKHFSCDILSSLFHFMSHFPTRLALPPHNADRLPPTAILNALLLKTTAEHSPASPPPKKRKNGSEICSLGLCVSEMVSSHKELLSDVVGSSNTPSDIVCCACTVKTYSLSLFAILDSNLRSEAGTHDILPSLSFLLSLLVKLLQKVTSVELAGEDVLEMVTFLVKSLFSSHHFVSCLLPRSHQSPKPHTPPVLGKRSLSLLEVHHEGVDVARGVAVFVNSVAMVSSQWRNSPFYEDVLSCAVERAVSCPDGCTLTVIKTLFPWLSQTKKTELFSACLDKCLLLLTTKGKTERIGTIFLFLVSCLSTNSHVLSCDDLTQQATGPIQHSSVTQDEDLLCKDKEIFSIPVPSVEAVMKALTACETDSFIFNILEIVLFSIFQHNDHSTTSSVPADSDRSTTSSVPADGDRSTTSSVPADGDRSTTSSVPADGDELVGKLTRAARSIEHHLEEYTRITGISVAPLLASESLAKLSRAGGVGAVDVDALNPDTLKRYLSSILLRPTLRSAQIGALILSCSSAALRCLEGILAGQPSPPNQSSPTTKVLLPLFRAYLQQKQSCLKNNPCLLVILTEWLWDACSEDVILGGEGSGGGPGGLSGGESGGMSGAVLELLVTASPCKKLNKQEKKLFKKLLKIREVKHGQWTSSHLKVLSALVPLVMKQSHISLLSSLLMWLLRDVRDLLCSETKTCGSELCLLEVATSCVSVCCRNKNELVSILDSSEFGDVFNIILKRVLRRHYCDMAYMDLLCGLVAMAYGRESSFTGSDVISGDMVVKMVWNHSKFLDVMLCNLESEPSTQLVLVKGAVVRLLVSLMEYTECSRSHVPLLLAAYQGTMNSVDCGLLFLMHSYEGRGVEMGEFRPFMFGRHALEHYQSRQKLGWLMWKDPSFDEVLAMFERDKVFHSLSHFPLGKSLEPTNPFVHVEPADELCSPLEGGDDVYDPSFMLPFFAHHLEAGFVVDCQRFIESGCWGYLVASLTSSSEDVRLATCHCLSLFKSQLEGARFREKNQIVLLMEVLRNSLATGDPPASEVDRDEMETTTLSDAPQSLLSVHAQLFARLAVLFLRPESELYPILCDFLVYRPNLDLKTLPFANLLFYSSSPQAATERVWILKVLVDGLRTEQDYKLYKKLGITSSVMAFWHSNIVEPEAKSLIVKLLWRMVQLPHSLRDLVKRQGLFAWLHRALIALRETSKQRELLILSCDSWETWITMVTEAAEEKGYIPYPHQMYEISMILATVAMETPCPGV